jgi:Ala-tRNA(Pro) deacylase
MAASLGGRYFYVKAGLFLSPILAIFRRMTEIIPEIIPTPEPLASRFAALGITAVTYAHPAVFTVEEGEGFKHRIPGGHTKNLFLKDKKGQLWLVTAHAETLVDLKSLPAKIGAARLSFGSADRLKEALHVTPGAVTALALMNDAAQQSVRFVLDRRLLDFETINCHPLRNDQTTCLAPHDLLKFIKDLGYAVQITALESVCDAADA